MPSPPGPGRARASLAAAVAVVLLALTSAGQAQAQAPEATPLAWGPVAGLPLTEPEQLRSTDGVLKVTLDVERKTIGVSGSPILARSFNGRLIGPTLRVHPGDAIEVTFRNATAENTNIHYHGMHVSPKHHSDNVFRTFSPRTTVRSKIVLPTDHSPGTYWYHAHFHGNTEEQVMGGMSGLIVVEGLEQLLPEELRGITQRQLAIRDLQTQKGLPDRAALLGSEIDPGGPTTRLVNGLLQPRTDLRSGETQLWRLANVGADLYYDVDLQGHRLRILAEDGSPVWRVRTVDHLVLPPGKRYDVLVEGGEPGRYALRSRSTSAQGAASPPADLMHVDVLPAVAGEPDPSAVVPTRLATPAPSIADRPVARKRTFTFSFAKGPKFARINGEAFNPGKTNVAPYVNTVEEWTLRNVTGADHPFHIHVNDFQVVSVNGKPYRATGLQDVVTIPHQRRGRAGTVVVRIPFNRFTGHFVFHCHILGHEDGGMMMAVQVRRRGEPKTAPPGARRQHAHMLRTEAAEARAGARFARICRLRRQAAARVRVV